VTVTFSVAGDAASSTATRPATPAWDADAAAWAAWHGEVEALDGPSVNVSNTNAAHLLALLGLFDTGELVGQLAADDFLGRVLLALAVNPADAGIPATSTGGPGTGTALVVDCGRRVGYTEARLDQLRTVAEAARAAGRAVVWS
jgi:hypothetical protein